MSREITIVSNNDDWEGLYVDGKLVTEDHKLSTYKVLTALGIISHNKTVDYDWMAERYNLPDNIEDVKFEED